MGRFILLGLDGACPDIIEQAVANGLMDNFKRLKEMGCWADNVPFVSAVTPGNWTSIATGSRPITNGISDFVMHTPGEPLDERYDVFHKGRNQRAEFVWDAYSDRGYRAATMAFPAALPQTKPHHLAIGDYGRPMEKSEPYMIALSRALTAGSVNPAGPYGWNEHEKVSLAAAQSDPGIAGFVPKYELGFAVKADNVGYGGKHPFRLYLGALGGKPAGVVVDGRVKVKIAEKEWTPYFERSFARDNQVLRDWFLKPPERDSVVGVFRFRIVRLDLEKGDLLLYISSVYPKYFFSTDESATKGLCDKLGLYGDGLGISRLLMEWIDDEAFYDEFRLQGVWQARAAVELVNNHDYKAVLTKWHAFDKFYHFFMQKIDPAGLNYIPEESARYEKLHRMLLSIADEMVGIVLDGLKVDTSLVVASDHGLMASRRAVWVNRFLAQHGYIKYHKDEQGKVMVDWSSTRAYVSGCLLLNVNVKGRDPQGIVEPGREHQELKEELIERLRGWKDPQTGLHVMTDVFDPRKDGAPYGLGSELDGDVRYFTRSSYTLYRSTAVEGNEVITDAEGPYLGDHGSCRPTARYGRGGEIGIFYAAGKGFRKNYHRSTAIFPCDIMPTLLHIAGERPLKQQEGAVLYDMLDEV